MMYRDWRMLSTRRIIGWHNGWQRHCLEKIALRYNVVKRARLSNNEFPTVV
jgi:hypothetical protein